MGLETFYQTSAADANGALVPMGMEYRRYYWSELEPSQGNFNFGEIMNDYNAARARGQGFSFGIMPYGNQTSGPQWLQNMGVSGYTFSWQGGPSTWAQNQDDPIAKAQYQTFIQALGAKFDGLPGLGSIDIASIGTWGEWENWAAKITAINGSAPGSIGGTIPLPPLATEEWYINLLFTYFPNELKTMQPGQGTATNYALGLGAGWRMNSFDQTGQQAAAVAGLPGGINNTTWQTAPVALEPYANLEDDDAATLQQAVDWALSMHASTVEDVNANNVQLNSSQLPIIQQLLMKLGYRYELTNLSYSATATPGDPLALTMTWQNVGDAPSYSNDVVAVQIRNSSGTVVSTTNTGIAVKNWLPGTYTVTPSVTLPASLTPGTYTIAIGIVNPTTMLPDIQLAIQGRDSNGWYPLGTVSVNQ